jgi:hypothetical protein
LNSQNILREDKLLSLFFRPKRERKLPAHLKAGDFEYSYKGPNDTAKNREAAAEKAALAETALSAKTALNTTAQAAAPAADKGNLLSSIDNKTVRR